MIQLVRAPRPDASSDTVAALMALGKTYPLPDTMVLLDILIKRTFEVTGGPDGIQGQRLLDLGCGSPKSLESIHLRRDGLNEGQRFMPWLCRLWSHYGGEAVGIDCNPVGPKEPFTFHQLDISQRGALSVFPDKSFDVINMRLLISSPDMMLRQNLTETERRIIFQSLEAEAQRILKPGGKYIFFDSDLIG